MNLFVVLAFPFINLLFLPQLIALLSAQDNADYLFVTVADVFPEDFNCVHFDYACIVRIQRSFNCNEAVYGIGFSDCDSHDHQYQAKQLMQLCCQLIDNKYDGNDNSIINTSSNDNSTCMNNSNCHKSCSSPKEKRKRSNSLIESSKQFVSSFFTRQSRSNTLSGSNDECKSNNNSNNTSMSWNYGNRSPKSISDITDSSMTPRSSTDTVSHSLIRPVTIHKKDNLELLLDYNNDNFSNKKKEKILCNDYKSFGYNMKDAKIVNNVSEIMISSFSDVEHYGCGGNADIYTATFTTENGNRTKVIIKMIKKIHVHNKLIAKEFEDELDILLRVQHKSIIKILGYGETPRKFIVLEFLANGTINTLLDDAKNKSYLYTKSPFTYRQVLEYGRDLAEGFDYLHRLWNENATILHRGKKILLYLWISIINIIYFILSYRLETR